MQVRYACIATFTSLRPCQGGSMIPPKFQKEAFGCLQEVRADSYPSVLVFFFDTPPPSESFPFSVFWRGPARLHGWSTSYVLGSTACLEAVWKTSCAPLPEMESGMNTAIVHRACFHLDQTVKAELGYSVIHWYCPGTLCFAFANLNFCARTRIYSDEKRWGRMTQLNEIKSEYRFPWNTYLALCRQSFPHFSNKHIFSHDNSIWNINASRAALPLFLHQSPLLWKGCCSLGCFSFKRILGPGLLESSGV